MRVGDLLGGFWRLWLCRWGGEAGRVALLVGMEDGRCFFLLVARLFSRTRCWRVGWQRLLGGFSANTRALIALDVAD